MTAGTGRGRGDEVPDVTGGGRPPGAQDPPVGPDDAARRVLPRPRAVRRFSRPRESPLVFTNGCFDLLHRGHAAFLAAAASLGDHLLVAINSDASVRRLKGPARPVVPQEDRAYVLASLRAVDAVTVFDEDTPLALVREVVPDVLVKGDDYAMDEVVGREVVEAAGGEVRLLPLEPGRSTSGLIRRVREAEAADPGGARRGGA